MAQQSGFAFDLGDEIKDKVTEYKGIIISRTEWLNGCRRYTIQAQGLKDGKPVDPIGLDEDNIVLVKASKVQDKLTKPTGGDQPMQRRGHDIRRT